MHNTGSLPAPNGMAVAILYSMFHLGWFIGRGYSVHGWNQPWSGAIGSNWFEPDLYVDMARAMERAFFDYLIIEDGSFIVDAHRGSTEWALRNAFAVPKADPMPLVPLIGQATSRLGIVATMATSFYPPFLAARLGATLDHLTHGRVGFNLVTAHNDRSAQNYGLDQHYEHALRYEMAGEWMELVSALWNSWEPGAIVGDRESGMFADYTKVHPINFEGKFFKSRGPLNLPPGPQGRPVICQAGGSSAGKSFAAKNADTIIALARDIPAAKAYRADIQAGLERHGRSGSSCKLMFCTSLILGDTQPEAEEKKRRRNASLADHMDARLGNMSFLTGLDFSKFPLDEPLPEIKTNASQAIVAAYNTYRQTKTLREILLDPQGEGMEFVGTPDSVAAQMGEAMAEIGGDGFLLYDSPTRRLISEVTDGLAPALQRKGLTRTAYEHKHFRDNLRAF
jgi:FMN-dependent oxidoreductase (nitrilotriacetate monooxygenase family)